MESKSPDSSQDNLKEKLLKTITAVDCYDLYNRTQRTLLVSSFIIDTQSLTDYNKSHIKNALHIPIQTMHDCEEKEKLNQNDIEKSIANKINDYIQKENKHYATSIYFYSNDINSKNNAFWKHISLLQYIIIKYEIFPKWSTNSQLYLCMDNHDLFSSKFPFLCSRQNEEQKQENESKTNGQNDIRLMMKFLKDNKGLYPNQIINDTLYLGCKDTACSKKVIIDLKITHIINCTLNIKNQFENDKDLKIKYLTIPIEDNHGENIYQYFMDTTKFIEDALTDDNSRILVHCRAGVSRSASIVIAYLMHRKKIKFEKALLYVKQRRDCIAPNASFMEQLKKFERQVFHQ